MTEKALQALWDEAYTKNQKNSSILDKAKKMYEDSIQLLQHKGYLLYRHQNSCAICGAEDTDLAKCFTCTNRFCALDHFLQHSECDLELGTFKIKYTEEESEGDF